MARPARSTLTPDIQKRIVDAIRLGATYELAAQYGGVTYKTFSNWMAKGEKGNEEFISFYSAIKNAEGAATVGWLAKIEQAATDGAWQAAAWKLERRYPRSYGRTVVEHDGHIDFTKMTDEELHNFVRQGKG